LKNFVAGFLRRKIVAGAVALKKIVAGAVRRKIIAGAVALKKIVAGALQWNFVAGALQWKIIACAAALQWNFVDGALRSRTFCPDFHICGEIAVVCVFRFHPFGDVVQIPHHVVGRRSDSRRAATAGASRY